MFAWCHIPTAKWLVHNHTRRRLRFDDPICASRYIQEFKNSGYKLNIDEDSVSFIGPFRVKRDMMEASEFVENFEYQFELVDLSDESNDV